ncbi:MAG: hypothetical protein IKO10_08780 [Lachnospiraceae bacterium]|nr:hypothetical protein [Lachnospiraceae bacterium]
MIIFNEKEMESEYCLSDDLLLVINSTMSLSDVFEQLQRGEIPDPVSTNIQCFKNGNGAVRLESDNMPEHSGTGANGILQPDQIANREEAMVQQDGYGQRKGLFRAYEQYQWGNKYEGFEIKPVRLNMTKEDHREIVRRHIALSSGVMPTLYKNKDLSLKELTAMSNAGNDLYRNFGVGSVAKNNPLPTEDDIRFYQRFTDYEKQLVRRQILPPQDVLQMKRDLETASCKGAVLTEDLYNKVAHRAKASDVIAARIHSRVPEFLDRFKAEFKKQYGFDRSPIIPEFITGLIRAKYDVQEDVVEHKTVEFSDKEIEDAVKSFNRTSLQATVYSFMEPGKDGQPKETKISVAQTRNPALIWLATKMPLQDVPQKMLQALATYMSVDSLKELDKKGFVDWIKEHKGDSVADTVKLFSVCEKIKQFDIEQDAAHLYQVAVNERADKDRQSYERKYGYKFKDNETAIRGRNIVVEQGPYKIYMLKPDDLRNFSVAYTENTHCCQHFGNAGEACVWKYTTDPFAACVVVEDKTGQIQAQGFVWTDEAKDLFVFDNIEYHHDPSAGKLTNIIEAYIEALPYKNVHIGMGYVEAKDQAWSGIGTPIDLKRDPAATMPTTLADRHVYSDYHTSNGSIARVMKREDKRTHRANMVKYTVNTNGLKITNPGDEPTKWDALASKDFSFMLNDCSRSIEERIRLAESFRDNPSKEMQLSVMATHPEAILTLEHPDPEVQMKLFENPKTRDIARQIQNPTVELQAAFVTEDPSYLKTIQNPDPGLLNAALERNGLLISAIQNPSDDNIRTALAQNGYAYRFIPADRLTEEFKMIAVQQAPKIASLLKNPSPELQLAAVRQDPDVLLLINRPTLSAQMAAINRKPDLVLSMKRVEEPVARVAVEQNPAMIRKFQFIYPELRMDAIQRNGFVIRELKDITQEEYDVAIAQNPDVANIIQRPEALQADGRILTDEVRNMGMEPTDGDGGLDL